MSNSIDFEDSAISRAIKQPSSDRVAKLQAQIDAEAKKLKEVELATAAYQDAVEDLLDAVNGSDDALDAYLSSATPEEFRTAIKALRRQSGGSSKIAPSREKYHRMLDEAMNETFECNFFLPQFVRKILQEVAGK